MAKKSGKTTPKFNAKASKPAKPAKRKQPLNGGYFIKGRYISPAEAAGSSSVPAEMSH